jgi:hypothetical protein
MIFLPNQRRETSIKLQTRKGTDIENYQYYELGNYDQAELRDTREEYRNKVTFKTEIIPIFNCHGFTFASGRTGIYDSTLLWKIIDEDGYTEIKLKDVMPGDIVLYIDHNTGDIEHSAVVISNLEKDFSVPYVISKWGKFSVVIHWVHVCPYDTSNIRYFRMTK